MDMTGARYSLKRLPENKQSAGVRMNLDCLARLYNFETEHSLLQNNQSSAIDPLPSMVNVSFAAPE
jgi:hypothetical protein